MRKYLQAVRLFVVTSFAAEMEYRINFVLAAASSLLSLAGSIFSLSLFYRAGHRLGGWAWPDALLVMGMFTLLDGVAATWLSPNLNRIVDHARDGTLDFVLLKPVDSQFWVSTRYVSVWGFPNVIFGVALIVVAGTVRGLSAADYAAGLAPLLLGTVILYSLWFLLASTCVWFVKIYNVTYVLRSLLEAGRYPAQAYPAAYRFVFTFVLPVAFLTTVPAQAMLGTARLQSLGLATALAAGLFLAARAFWRLALRYYTSASS